MGKITNFIQRKWFAITVVLVMILQFFRIFSGHGITDEHFYSALSYKMATYGSLFIDDWDIGQMFVFLTIPWVKLYLFLFKTTEGIVLYFRFLYLILVSISASLIYLRFSKSFKYTKLAVIIYLLFVPFNIASLSYNTLSINLLMQSVCLYRLNENKIFSLLSGFAFAGAVLASPYLCFAYFIVFIYQAIKAFKVKQLDQHFVYSFLAIVFLALIFLINILLSGSLSLVVKNIQATLNEPSYESSFLHSIFRVVYHCYRAFGVLIIPYAICIFIECFKTNSKLRLINYCLAIICIVYAVFIHPFDLSIGGHCVVNLILTVLALPLVVRTKNKDIKIIYTLFLFHAFAISISSNVGIRSTANVLINSVVLFCLLLENDSINTQLKWCFYIFVVLVYLYTRVSYNYIEPTNGDVQIKHGPLKYLYTDQAFIDEYNQLYQTIQYINKLDESNQILIESDLSWIYLALEDKEVINYSLIRHIYPKEDIVKRIHQFLDFHDYDNYYVYIMDNTYDVGITDLFSNYKVINDPNIEFGQLYLVR